METWFPKLESSIVLTSLIALAAGTVILTFYQKSKTRNHVTRVSVEKLTGWVDGGGKVEKLWMYPVKSCKGIEVDYFSCTKLGPVLGSMRDRVFMFVNNQGNFVTARSYPKLVLIETIVTENRITLRAPEMEDLTAEIPQRSHNETLVQIWGEKLKATDCGESVSEWISSFLSMDGDQADRFRMVYHADVNTRRDVNTNVIWPLMFKEDGAAFTDLAPYLLINEDSVQDLCGRLDDPVSISSRNFRPNITISGGGPFAEDNWSYVKIGEVIFRHTKPCDRCVLTTVNPDKGEKDLNQEPLRTLRKYRCATDPKIKASIGTSPLMGINLAIEKEGQIRMGDKVEYI